MKTKPLLPSLREKKRYLAFEIISRHRLAKNTVMTSLRQNILQMLGIFESAQAGLMFLPDKYDSTKQRGILRVNHNYLDRVKASFCFIKSIDNKAVIIRSLGASGMINKATKHLKD